MPANVNQEYREAEERWRNASDPGEKLRALQDMLRTIPKHKGTEKMQGDIKRRIAKMRDAKESQKQSGGKRRPDWVVERQGSGQIMVAGPPNSGKSSIIASLTNADPEIADYPFSTVMPAPAMLKFENVQIQLVDLPPLHAEMSPPWLADVFRGADGILFVLDLSDDDILHHAEAALAFLEEKKFTLTCPEGFEDMDMIEGETTPQSDGIPYPCLIAANKFEESETAELRLDLLTEMWKEAGHPPLPLLRVSTKNGMGIECLKRSLWVMLDKIRVFTRPPGQDPDYSAPFVLDRGATALDLAYAIHKDIGARFKYARAWGAETFDAQMVGRDHVLCDGDVLEVHSDS